MFRPRLGSGNIGGNSSESESDWDTTADFPTPRQLGPKDSSIADSARETTQRPPTPRTRTAVSGPGDRGGDGTPRSARREDPGSARREEPGSARREVATPASVSGVQLSGEPGSRGGSPAPPFTGGHADTSRNGDDNGRGRQPTPPESRRQGKGGGGSAQVPRISAVIEDDTIPKWDDSDVEQQTLRDLHTTLKKEKTREAENNSGRRQVQDEGDFSSATGRNASVLEKWMQGREDKKKQKKAQEKTQMKKSASVSMLDSWPKGFKNAMAEEVTAPYQSFVMKDPAGNKCVYYFSKGSSSYYEVEEEETEAVMPKVADRVETIIQRGWREFFGALRIITSIVVFLLVELSDFLINHVLRPLLMAYMVTVGNNLVKPLLAALFSLILQPFLVFLWNVFSGIRHVCQPVLEIVGSLMTQGAILLRAFRLVEVNCGDRDPKGQKVAEQGRQWGRRDSSVV